MNILLRRRARLLFGIALGLLFTGVFAPSTHAQGAQKSLSLNQAITLTLAHNPQLHQFSVKKDWLLAMRTSSNLRPVVNAGIEIENFGGQGTYSGVDSSDLTLSLSSVIELGSKRHARNLVADAQLDVLEYQKQALTLDILADVTSIFVNTLELQELIELALDARNFAQNTLVIVRNRAHQGAAPVAEVKRANAAVAQTQLHLNALQHAFQRNLVKLSSYWGETSVQWTGLQGNLYSFEKHPQFSELYQRILASPAVEIFASEQRLKTAELQLAKTHSTSDIGWNLGVRRFEETGDAAFTAGMTIPLFSGKRNQARIRTALAESNAVEYKRQSALQRLHVQLFEAHSQRQQNIEAIRVFQETIIPELTTALQSTQHAYETGRYGYQDWMAAQQELLKAQQTLIENATSAALNQAIIEQLIAEPLNR